MISSTNKIAVSLYKEEEKKVENVEYDCKLNNK